MMNYEEMKYRYVRVETVLGQNGRGQNGTDKMAPIESSINQAIQLPLTI